MTACAHSPLDGKTSIFALSYETFSTHISILSFIELKLIFRHTHNIFQHKHSSDSDFSVSVPVIARVGYIPDEWFTDFTEPIA